MANRFPLLEAMRAERQRREDEITAPFRSVIDGLQLRIGQLSSSLRALESALGSEIGKYSIEQIGRDIGVALQKHIMTALPDAYKSGAKMFSLTLPVEILRFMDPKSLESEILRQYSDETAPRLSVRTDTRPDDGVTILDIHIPPLGYRHAMTDIQSRRRH